MAVYGNVNVKYAPCKSVAQLHSAADYILGKKKEQLSSSVIKTKSELYNAFGCNRDNFANSVLMTRKMHQKKYSRFFPRDILAQKLSISFHPEDNDKLTYAEAYKMAEDFAREFFWKKGFEVLFAVHVDTEHVHVHFLVNNCNQKLLVLKTVGVETEELIKIIKEADILFEKREEPFNIYEYCKK